MRADAQRNREHLLATAGAVLAEQGAAASLREIARRAGVGLGTMHRHFPSRVALMEALLRAQLDELTRQASSKASGSPGEALQAWFSSGVAFVRSYSGVVDLMAEAIADPGSALHSSCQAVRSAGTALLSQAQASGEARSDIDGTDLFALIGALGWIGDQSSFAGRTGQLTALIAESLMAESFIAAASPRMPVTSCRAGDNAS